MATHSLIAMENLIRNMDDVNRLLKIHKKLTGSGPGRRAGVEVLNKSGVVLIMACWEAFIEDLAKEAYDYLISKADTYTIIPNKVRVLASKSLRQDNDESKIWELAENGWRKVLHDHKNELFTKHIGKFNTPKPDNINDLFEKLIGLKDLSISWRWERMSVDQSKGKLVLFNEDRGAIAHRAATKEPISIDYVRFYRNFVYRLAVKSANHVNKYLSIKTGDKPWSDYTFGKKK